MGNVKLEIKELTEQYCRNIANNRKLEKGKLKNELDKLEKNYELKVLQIK